MSTSTLTERQQAVRATGIGASEIAAVAGLHPTKRPIDVYAEKVGEVPPFEGNEDTRWGQRLERVVAEAWLEEHPGKSIFTPGTLRHREHAFAVASPDRIVVPEGRRARDTWEQALEIKNVALYRAEGFGEEGTDEVPEHMLVQVQWQLEVADLPRGVLVPLIGGNRMRQYPIERDRELGAMLLEVAGRFWADHIEPRVPPRVDGSRSYATFLRKRFPAVTGPMLPPTPELEELVGLVREAKRAAKAAAAVEAEAANRLRATIGEAEGIEGLCTLRLQQGSTYTVTREPGRVLRLAKEK